VRAAFANVRAGGIAQGGSTIPQQIIKQRFLTHERTWRRKIAEMILAVALDVRYSKDDILELYLNDVYLGHYAGSPILGIDEAARLWFDKPPRALRVDEAALLAAMIRAPNRDNPQKRPDVARARRNAILEVMRDRGWIDESQYRDAIVRDVDGVRGALSEQPYPYYLRALRAEVERAVGPRKVVAGGLSIDCEIDPAAQRAAERAVASGAARLRSRFRWIRDQARKDPLQPRFSPSIPTPAESARSSAAPIFIARRSTARRRCAASRVRHSRRSRTSRRLHRSAPPPRRFCSTLR
jgi:membrane peptidoglycan carboxypeptidase